MAAQELPRKHLPSAFPVAGITGKLWGLPDALLRQVVGNLHP